jgi:transposase-like protein
LGVRYPNPVFSPASAGGKMGIMNKASFSARERWRRIVEQQQRSGVSVARFCRERGVAQSSLFAWKRRLAREARATATPAFVAITAAAEARPSNGSGSAVELHLGDGRHLLLRPGFDPATLATALAVLAADNAEGR